MKRHMFATKMNRETVILTKAFVFRSIGQFEDTFSFKKDSQLFRILKNSSLKYTWISCLMTSRKTSWRMKVRCDSNIFMKLRRADNSSRLVTKIRSLAESIHWTRARRWRIMTTWFSFSHSSNASTIKIVLSGRIISDNDSRMSFSNCFFIILMNMAKYVFKAFLRSDLRSKKLYINCVAMMVKNLKALPRSSSSRLKKKLTPNWRRWEKSKAIVRLIVDLSMPTAPFNQKMHLLCEFRAQSSMFFNKSIFVFEWHKGFDWLAKKSKAASSMKGSLNKIQFVSILWLTFKLSDL